MRLTDNFTLEELTKSSTADRFNIKNEPSKEGISKLKVLCETILHPPKNVHYLKFVSGSNVYDGIETITVYIKRNNYL